MTAYAATVGSDKGYYASGKLSGAGTVYYIAIENGTKYYDYGIHTASALAANAAIKLSAINQVGPQKYTKNTVGGWKKDDKNDDGTPRSKVTRQEKKMDNRKCLSEHPFGTIKRTVGESFFLLRRMFKTEGEMALYCLSYNLGRQYFGYFQPEIAVRG